MTMSVRRSIRAAAIAVLLVFAASLAMRPPAVAALTAGRQATVSSLPDRLSDAEFWSLVSNVSEPGGSFRISDNFTSNELEIGRVFTMLRERGVEVEGPVFHQWMSATSLYFENPDGHALELLALVGSRSADEAVK